MPSSKHSNRFARARAFSVHVLTASGAVFALLALLAAARGEWTMMFVWLGIALLIDGIDGSLARWLRVGQILPRWSGDVLDVAVDYTTYVFVPAFAIATGGLLPPVMAIPAGAAIVLTSAIYFSDRQMKTRDYHFEGFPALWNGVVFHLFLLKLEPWAAFAIVAVLVALTFMPIAFIHPFRVVRLRIFNMAVLLSWAGLGIYALAKGLQPGLPAAWAATLCGLYLLAAGLISIRLKKQ